MTQATMTPATEPAPEPSLADRRLRNCRDYVRLPKIYPDDPSLAGCGIPRQYFGNKALAVTIAEARRDDAIVPAHELHEGVRVPARDPESARESIRESVLEIARRFELPESDPAVVDAVNAVDADKASVDDVMVHLADRRAALRGDGKKGDDKASDGGSAQGGAGSSSSGRSG